MLGREQIVNKLCLGSFALTLSLRYHISLKWCVLHNNSLKLLQLYVIKWSLPNTYQSHESAQCSSVEMRGVF